MDRGLAYRKMLLDVSKLMSKDDLTSFKFMCTGEPIDIPKRRLEEIENATDLWTALEERDGLSETNTEFLEALLSHAAEGRTDLLKIVSDYKRLYKTGTNVTSSLRRPVQATIDEDFVGEDLSREFDYVVSNIGRNWRQLARKLKLSENDIECITEDNIRSLREQSRQMLILWKRTYREAATKNSLITALKSCLFNDMAYHIEIGKYDD